MRRILFAAAALALSSCASHNTNTSSHGMHDQAMNSPTLVLPDGPRTVVLGPNDRTPSSTPNVAWIPAEFSYTVSSPSSRNSYSVAVNQQMSWEETENYQSTCTEYRDVQVPTTCNDVRCTGGSGQSEAWNRFYNGSRGADQKAQALADAIKGVGPATARALVDGHYFNSKPRSWDAFIAEIDRAIAAGAIQRSVRTEVLKYAAENAATLGYGANSCQIVQVSCTAWVSQLVSYSCTKQRQVTRTRVVDTRNIAVDISVNGAKLLPFESDTLRFSIDENGRVAGYDGDAENNRYTVTQSNNGGRLQIMAEATARKPRQLTRNVVQRTALTLNNNQPTFVLNIDPKYLPSQEDPGSQLVLDYTVKSCQYGWTGQCVVSRRTAGELKHAQITQAQTVIPVEIAKHFRGQVSFTLTRTSSAYFSASPSPEMESDDLKMPR